LKFSIRGGSIDNSSSAAITTSTWNPQQSWGGNWTFIGSGGASSDLFLGNGAVTLTGTRQVTVQNAATTLTIGGGVTDVAKGYGVTKAGLGKLVLRGSHSYLGKTTVSAGTLSLGNGTSNSSLSDAATLEIASGATLNANWDAANVDTVFMLTFDGTPQAAGTWGATGSGADPPDARITGAGIINNFGGLYTDGSFFWDGPTTGGTGDGVSNGGAGTWSAANANWDKGFTAREGWTDSTANKAIFGGTAGTVTLGSAITLGELIISSTATSGYKIEGQTLNFGGAKKITVQTGSVEIKTGITGSPDVDQIFGANLYFNPTSANMSLNTIIRNGDSYLYLQGTTTGNTLGFISIGASGVNAGNAKLNFNGTGKWTLLGNVYAGEMYIQSGEVVANGALSGDYKGIYVQTTGVLHYNNAGAVKGPSNGSSSTLRFFIQGGSIDNSSSAAITTSTWNPKQEWGGNWTFIGSNGASSDLYLGNGAVSLTGTRQVTVQNAATTLTVGGIISGTVATYGLTKAGLGTLKLSGANSYTGATTVNNGTLAVTGSLGATAVTVNSSATLAGSGNIGGSVTIASGAHHALAVAATPGAQATRAITGTLTLTSGNILDLTAASTPATGVYVLATATVNITGTPPTVNHNGTSGTVSIDTASTPKRLLLTVPPSGTLIQFM
jgi:autotransporter-associated beta strand protein